MRTFFTICFVQDLGLVPLPHNSMEAAWFAVSTCNSSRGEAACVSPCGSPSAPTQGMQSLETASMAFEIFTTNIQVLALSLFRLSSHYFPWSPGLRPLFTPLNRTALFLSAKPFHRQFPGVKRPPYYHPYPSSQLLLDLQNPFPESPPPGSLP